MCSRHFSLQLNLAEFHDYVSSHGSVSFQPSPKVTKSNIPTPELNIWYVGSHNKCHNLNLFFLKHQHLC